MNTAQSMSLRKRIPMRMSIGIKCGGAGCYRAHTAHAACVATYILDINLRPVILRWRNVARAIAISAINDAVVEVMNGEPGIPT